MREKQRLDILSSKLLEHVRMVEATATDHPHSLPLPVTKTELGSEKASPIHSTGKRGYIVYNNQSGLACRNVVSYRLLFTPDMDKIKWTCGAIRTLEAANPEGSQGRGAFP